MTLYFSFRNRRTWNIAWSPMIFLFFIYSLFGYVPLGKIALQTILQRKKLRCIYVARCCYVGRKRKWTGEPSDVVDPFLRPARRFGHARPPTVEHRTRHRHRRAEPLHLMFRKRDKNNNITIGKRDKRFGFMQEVSRLCCFAKLQRKSWNGLNRAKMHCSLPGQGRSGKPIWSANCSRKGERWI